MTEVHNGGQTADPTIRTAPKHPRMRRASAIALVGTAVVAISSMVGVSALLIVYPFVVGSRYLVSSHAVPQASTSAPMSSVEQVAAKVLPSVVTLKTDLGGGEFDEGSGVILTPDGLIMTNDHVVAAAASGLRVVVRTMVTFNDGQTAPFTVVAADPKSDIAVIRVQGVSALTPISFGSLADLRVGQQVVAVGAPLDLSETVTTGVVSALDRPVCGWVAADKQVVAYDAIQTDAALNPGSSGGALVDMHGQLIGVTSAMASLGNLGGSGDMSGGSIGIGFAIPVDHAQRVARELIATGTASHARLGAQVSGEPSADGATIIRVAAGSPAEMAGLSSGAVVTKVDGQLIDNAAALAAAVQSKAPGVNTILAVIDPSGEHRTIRVSLGTDQGLAPSPIDAEEGVDI